VTNFSTSHLFGKGQGQGPSEAAGCAGNHDGKALLLLLVSHQRQLHANSFKMVKPEPPSGEEAAKLAEEVAEAVSKLPDDDEYAKGPTPTR
jgi:hypothetical protein